MGWVPFEPTPGCAGLGGEAWEQPHIDGVVVKSDFSSLEKPEEAKPAAKLVLVLAFICCCFC